jgi:hypothetical protein
VQICNVNQGKACCQYPIRTPHFGNKSKTRSPVELWILETKRGCKG